MRRALFATLLALVTIGAACDGCEETSLTRTYEFCLRPGDMDFGPQLLRTAETRTIAVTNCGNVPVDRIDIELVPLDADGEPIEDADTPFLIVETVVSSPLGVGDHFFVPVRFRPTEVGVFEAELQFSLPGESLGGPAARQYVRGEGVLAPSCSVSVAPENVTFSSLLIGEEDTSTVTVTNQGTGPCRVSGARITEAPEHFALVEADETIIEPGESAALTVAYRPTEPGAHTGEVSVVVEGEREVSATLNGDASEELLCRFTGDPDPVVFPRATVNFSETTASGSLISVGEIPCTIASLEIVDGASDFTLLSGPEPDTSVAPGESTNVELEFHPTAVGQRSGVLRVTTAEGTSFNLALSGLADPSPRCALRFTPAPVFFDALGVGLSAERTLTATNVSIVDCEIGDITVAEGAAEFSIVSPPGVSTLPAGESLSVGIRFTPQVAAPAFGVVRIEHGSEASEADLLGFGSFADFRLTPRSKHFGMITEGCVSDTYEITLTNVGPVVGRVDFLGYSAISDPNFEILDGVAPGTMLQPGETRVVRARMKSAPVIDMHAGQLEVRSTGTVNPVLRASFFGTTESEAEAQRTDVFTQRDRPVVDILFVIDNSGSMGDEQQSLRNNFSSFINFFTAQANVDWHIGVTTTDTRANRENGKLVAPFIASSGPNSVTDPIAAFTAMADVGTGGDGTEKGLEASALAVSSPHTDFGGANYGFLRPNALLSIIYVSDENDFSAGAVSEWLDRLLAAKDYNTETLIANAIAGDVPGGCSGPGGSATAAPRYLDIVLATGGVYGSICTSDWAAVMEQIGLGTYLALTRFQLTRDPDPDTLVVIVDGVVIPQDELNGWSWDPVDNSIKFNGTAVPSAGAEIEVSYTADCILP